MDNAAQIDLHTASVVLNKQDHSIALFQYVPYIQHTTAVACQRTSVVAAYMTALCPMAVDRLY